MSDWPSGYACVDMEGIAAGTYSLRPLRWEDREPIRQWRNEQIEILRQAAPLAAADQDAYYAQVIAPQMSQPHPAQVLAAFLLGGDLIGYGGLVHISWEHRRGEVSFITATERQTPEQFETDLGAFFPLIIEVAERLGLHRLTTETYAFRTDYVRIAEDAGFLLEGRLREHIRHEDGYEDSLIHGMLLPRIT